MLVLETSSKKICSRCKKEKQNSGRDFPPDKRRPYGIASYCRRCNSTKGAFWRRKKYNNDANYRKRVIEYNRKLFLKKYRNDEDFRNRTKFNSWKRELKRIFGMTPNQYDELLKIQNESCGICGISSKEIKKRLSVDHDHITGKVRGLLCTRCNMAIGMFDVDKLGFKLLEKAKNYLLCTIGI